MKYTLACFHAAQDDPAWRTSYLVAATTLTDWWRVADDVDRRRMPDPDGQLGLNS